MNQICPIDDAFTLVCRTSDPYDASIRLLNDAQKFGAELIHLNFALGEGILSMTIRLGAATDYTDLAQRFGRHLSIEAILPADTHFVSGVGEAT